MHVDATTKTAAIYRFVYTCRQCDMRKPFAAPDDARTVYTCRQSEPYSAFLALDDANNRDAIRVLIRPETKRPHLLGSGLDGRTIKPGDDLLSHGEAPHYHWRNLVSLPSSRWDRVVPRRCGRRENWLSVLFGVPVASGGRSVGQTTPTNRGE